MSTGSFLGNGWQFPVSVDDKGRIKSVSVEECVRRAIWMILSTSRGERVMRPDFGCGIHDLVFAPNSAETAGRVASAVRQALLEWEPRIDLVEVAAAPDRTERARLLIEIRYRVRSTNTRYNLVYPFYLE